VALATTTTKMQQSSWHCN